MTSGCASSAGSPGPPRALVTRPEPEARRWADQLCAGGIEAEALPLIEIIPPVDSQPVRQAWALLGSYAAVMFVSAHAVEQFFEQKPHLPSVQWSQNAINTVAWATGPGTGRALFLAGLAPQQIEMPGADAPQFDSEALWLRVGAQVRPGQRVLIVRGADAQGMEAGRDWLGEQLRRAGVQVDRVLAYQRGVPVWSHAQLARAGAAVNDGTVWLFSSSEAIANLLDRLPGRDWSAARAVATHPRIAASARRAGFGVVCESRPTLEAVMSSIKSSG